MEIEKVNHMTLKNSQCCHGRSTWQLLPSTNLLNTFTAVCNHYCASLGPVVHLAVIKLFPIKSNGPGPSLIFDPTLFFLWKNHSPSAKPVSIYIFISPSIAKISQCFQHSAFNTRFAVNHKKLIGLFNFTILLWIFFGASQLKLSNTEGSQHCQALRLTWVRG